MMGPLVKPKDIRRHGTILPMGATFYIYTNIEGTCCLIRKSEETRQIKLIAHGLPAIKQFVNEELSKSPLSNRTNRIP
jgi:histone deacetylase 6